MPSNLLGLLLMTLASANMTTRYAGTVSDNLDQRTMALTAETFQDLLQGANKYVQEHNGDLQSAIGVGGYKTVLLSDLASDNDLPPGFSPGNSYGQQWQVVVQQPQSGVLRALVYSNGGTSLSAKAEAGIAGMTGHYGGFVPYNGMYGNLNSSMAQGAGGAWNLSLSGLPNPGPGHLYGLTTYDNGSLVSNDYLYRHAVPNHPEYTTMATTLNMGGNDVRNAGNGQFNGRIGTNGRDPNSVPPGWSGGVSTIDVSATGSIGAGPPGQRAVAWLSSSGSGHTDGDFTTGHDLSVGNTAWINNAHVASGNNLWVGNNSIYGDPTNLALRTGGAAFVQHQDGTAADIHSQNNFINTLYANGAVLPSGESLSIGSGALYGDGLNLAIRPAGGRVYLQNRFSGGTVGLYGGQIETTQGVVYDTTDANPGYGCGPNGRVAAKYDGSGEPLACINGKWSSMTATFNNGSWVSGWLGFNTTNGPFTNYAASAAALNVICPQRVSDLRIQIIMDGTVMWDSGGYVGGGYSTTQSGSVIIPAGKSYYVILTGFPNENGQCYIAARW